MITPGQQGDITTAPALLEGIPARHVLADKAYDSNALRSIIKAKRAKAAILAAAEQLECGGGFHQEILPVYSSMMVAQSPMRRRPCQ